MVAVIGYFPLPHPEEIFYSICARAAERLAFTKSYALVEALFNSPQARANVAFPSRLRTLISNLPPGHTYTVDGIINDHSLVRFYEPFLPVGRSREIREMLARDERSLVYQIVGNIPAGIRDPAALRSCPLCDTEDEVKHGERYWHRLPQIAGIEICPAHEVFFNATTASRDLDRRGYVFESAQRHCDQQGARPIDPRNRQHQILLDLARDADWLLRHNDECPGIRSVRRLNQELLQNRGYMSAGKRLIDFQTLHERFVSFVSEETLGVLQSALDPAPSRSWLRRLAREDDDVQAPIRQLLFVRFMGETIQTFFAKLHEDAPLVYRGPWPCLNRICPNYKTLVIDAVEEQQHGKVGVFTCPHCDLRYSRFLGVTTFIQPVEFVAMDGSGMSGWSN